MVASSDGSGPSAPSVSNEARVETVAGARSFWTSRAVRKLRRGDSIGRHVVLDCVGSGGMGVVYAAYDPELDRKLAVKLLRGESKDDEGRARLVREAQAMARLSHPNVAIVHDVGTLEGHVYVAMEFIEGLTLGAWVALGSHTREEIVACFVAAGRGLEAAHNVGLVHRDFKPDNVIVGDDGRPRVLDFGLARQAGGESVERARAIDNSIPDADPLDTPITRVGSVAGTPAYMAPEQHFGLTAEPAADQFSFCVALYEALYGERPYPGKTMHELALAISLREVNAPTSGSAVPTSLRRALLRGLDPEPGERWPSMAPLLEALTADPRAGRRRLNGILGAAAVGGVLVTGYLANASDPCADVASRIDEVWAAPRRAQARDAFVTTGLEFAADAWDRVEASLQAYAAAWAAMRREVCEATHVRHEQSSELLDLRMECLDRRLAEYDALIGVLAEADAEIAENSGVAVARLRSLDRCADAEALRARLPPPEHAGTRTAVEAIRGHLDRAEVLGFAGRVDEALAIVEPLAAEAESLGYEPLQAEVEAALGSRLEAVGRYPAAEERLREATWRALSIEHDRVAVDTATDLVRVVGRQLSRHAEGLTWARQAESLVRRTGGTWEREAALHSAMGALLEDAARFDESVRHHERALQIREAHLPAGALEIAGTRNALGSVLQAMGQYERALTLATQALGEAEDALGPLHPQLRGYLNNVGIVQDDLGDFRGAVASYKRAISVSEPSLGADSPGIAIVQTNIGVSLLSLGESREALEYHFKALAVWEASVGRQSNEASTLSNIAAAYLNLNEYDNARPRLERAIALWTELYGPDHPSCADGLTNLGIVFTVLDEPEQAREHLERAIEIYERAQGPSYPVLAVPLGRLGRIEAMQGNTARAIELLERGVAIGERGPPNALAQLLFDLAKAKFDAGKLDQARPLAERARTLWLSIDRAHGTAVGDVDAWLQQPHGAAE